MRLDWYSAQGPIYEPSPVDTSPPRRAVLRHDRWYVFPGVLEAIEHARKHNMIGAQVFVNGKLAATIEAFNFDGVFRANGIIPAGLPRYGDGVLEVA